MNRDPISRPSWPTCLAVAVTLAVAACAGVMSAITTHAVALTSGVVTDSAEAWLLPVIIEGGAVVSAVVGWTRRRGGQPARLALSMLAGLLILSLIVNARHAWHTRDPFAIFLAACPPVILLGLVEMVLPVRRRDGRAVPAQPEREQIGDPMSAQAREQVAPKPTEQVGVEPLSVSTEPPTEREQTPARVGGCVGSEREQEAAQVSVSAVKAERAHTPKSAAQPTEQIKDPTPKGDAARSLHAVGEPRRLTAGERSAIVDALLAEHGSLLTQAMVAETTGVPRSTAGRDLRAAKARAAERASA